MIEPKIDKQLGDNASLGYESLRFAVLEKNEINREESLGLVLFIRQGMLAWVEALYKCDRARFCSAERTNSPTIFAYKTQSEITKVLANITLFNLEEYES